MTPATVLAVRAAEAREVQSLSGLWPIHYREAFAIEVDADRSPAEWARLLLERAKPHKQAAMLTVWRLLGLDLAPPDRAGHVLGWRILRSDRDAVVLAVESRTGLTARIVQCATPRRLVHTMVIRYDRWVARPIWWAGAPRHRAFVRGLLDDVAVRSRTGLGHGIRPMDDA